MHNVARVHVPEREQHLVDDVPHVVVGEALRHPGVLHELVQVRLCILEYQVTGGGGTLVLIMTSTHAKSTHMSLKALTLSTASG